MSYTVLAPFYNKIGLAAAAEALTPRFLDYAQRNDWLGRRILDLGSGTGAGLKWLGRHTYTLFGVDSSPEMLAVAKASLSEAGVSAQLVQQDIRKLELRDTFDMVLAVNVLNEMDSLRDFEAVFKGVQTVLGSGKLFIFDLQTVEGLASSARNGDRLFYDQPDLSVVTRDRYDYERQALTRRYLIFNRNGAGWERLETEDVLRGYPIQAVGAMLQRTGFQLPAILNPNFSVYDPASSGVERVYFVARKV